MLSGTHDSTLVALSILIATVASYTALDLAGRIRATTGPACHAWLATAALAMGGGIWSMHFVAMLAFSMPGMEVQYDVGLTFLSLVFPIIVTGLGFFVVSRREPSPVAIALSGLLMGCGIVAMHYTGMAAMRMAADLGYDRLWVAISVLIAIGAATLALWLALRRSGLVEKLVAAGAMGLAISGMHYAAMQAAIFTAHSTTDGGHAHASLGQTNLALAVSATTFLILFLALVAAMFDRRFAMLAEREATTLRESEERFRNLYRNTPLPLHAFDASGTIEQVSDAWLDLLNYTREEVIGRSLLNFMTEDSARRRNQADWPRLLETGELKDAEYRLVRKDGEILDVLVSGKIERDASGRVVRGLGGIVDVTARKRAEGALRQAQKIESMGQLTGGVAHDFNNLLAVVLGNLELLRKRVPHDPRVMRLLDSAMEGARRGATLTERMLAFARRQDLRPEPVEVTDLVQGMMDLLRRSMGPMIRIETRSAADLPPAHVDANQLELAILNLVVNARDAMPDGGTVTITGKHEVLSSASDGLPAGDYIRLAITDTGEGMDDATVARATEPFFTTKGPGKGTGLGLSTVHGLAEQSGGRLALRSRKGEGTTAELWLPVSRERGEAIDVDPMPARAGVEARVRSLTVLVVDDDALVLANTAAMLEDLGHSALQAGSGRDALDLLQKANIVDLVITDQAMPGMSGVQLAGAVRARWPAIPILLATGYAELPPGTDLPKLNKPFLQSALARAIADVMMRTEGRRRVVPFRAKT